MTDEYYSDPLLDVFVYETTQLLEQLERSVLTNELGNCEFTPDSINDIFRIMHTIKGSSSIMMFDNISTLAHAMEDIFYYLKEEKPKKINVSELSDLFLACLDFLKSEMEKIRSKSKADGDASSLIEAMKSFLAALKDSNTANSYKTYNSFSIRILFEDGCEMENIRAYHVIRKLKTISNQISFSPENLTDDKVTDIIRKEGFRINIRTDYTYEMLYDLLMQTVFLKELDIKQM